MQRNRLHTVSLLALLASLLLSTACEKDDDTRVPAYLTELVEANTGHDGNVTTLTLDNGQTYPVSKSIKASVADTTYRCYATYMLQDDEITIYGLKHIFSAMPRRAELFKSRPSDPVKFISCWRSSRYLNVKIGIMTTGNGTHQFAFSEDSIVTNPQGQQNIYATLLHLRPETDAESFTEEMFLSMPIYCYDNPDTIFITMPTYEGMVTAER